MVAVGFLSSPKNGVDGVNILFALGAFAQIRAKVFARVSLEMTPPVVAINPGLRLPLLQAGPPLLALRLYNIIHDS